MMDVPALGMDEPMYRVDDVIEVGKVPAGFPTRFCLLTCDKRQYVAFYDEKHRMTVASRNMDSPKWHYRVLPSEIGWDSHNYITMAVDDGGFVHLSGNMHCVALVYFRMSKPHDIDSFERVSSMTGNREQRCTYPKFMRSIDDRLIFHYRDGGSGNGCEIYNVYDSRTQQWQALLDMPLLDGAGEMNAYALDPAPGPDGRFHMVWVWRDTSDCATNHHLSYARSDDLLNWQSASGSAVNLPMTIDETSLWVDPVPSGGGMINGSQRLVFDSDSRPAIIYHKSDENGNMQIFIAAFRDGKWTSRALTEWQKPILFSGHGSMGFIGISLSRLTRLSGDLFTLSYNHRDYGWGRLFVDVKKMQLAKPVEFRSEYPDELHKLQSNFEGMAVHLFEDLGNSGDSDVRYILRWETLGSNQDRPRKDALPPSSTLNLYKLVRQAPRLQD